MTIRYTHLWHECLAMTNVQVTNKVGGSEINYIKRFQNAHTLSVSIGDSYSEDQLMHTFLDNFRQGGKYSDQIASQQAD